MPEPHRPRPRRLEGDPADPNPLSAWDGRSRLPRAFLVDVDGTLVTAYAPQGAGRKRHLRPSAAEALEKLSRRAPVFLWSLGGPENGHRLTVEFPQIAPFVSGFFHKDDFPLHLVDHPVAIDDEGVWRHDTPHLAEIYVIPPYAGGVDDGILPGLVQELCESPPPPGV